MQEPKRLTGPQRRFLEARIAQHVAKLAPPLRYDYSETPEEKALFNKARELRRQADEVSAKGQKLASARRKSAEATHEKHCTRVKDAADKVREGLLFRGNEEALRLVEEFEKWE